MHPNSPDLEAFAVGEPDATTEAHVGACAECRAFVEKLGALAPVAVPKLDVYVEPRRRLVPILSIVVPLVAAALFFLVVKRHGDAVVPPPLPSATAPSGHEVGDPDTTFKGALPIAVVRERAGAQMRFTRSASIRPGDRLRVEVALDHAQIISAGVLGDDGSWLVLMPEGARTPGTHFSEKAARVDAEPLRGTILAGTPAQVALARSTHDFSGVSTLRLEWEQ